MSTVVVGVGEGPFGESTQRPNGSGPRKRRASGHGSEGEVRFPIKFLRNSDPPFVDCGRFYLSLGACSRMSAAVRGPSPVLRDTRANPARLR